MAPAAHHLKHHYATEIPSAPLRTLSQKQNKKSEPGLFPGCMDTRSYPTVDLSAAVGHGLPAISSKPKHPSSVLRKQ